MSKYRLLNYLIFYCNKKRYCKLKYSWNKVETIKFLSNKIPDLKISFIKEVDKIEDILNYNEIALKSSYGHSSRNIYILKNINNTNYYDIVRKRVYSFAYLKNILSKLKRPYLEKKIGDRYVPYDIKVHIFFGRICFFYIYNKGYKKSYSKARYDKNLKYISYSKMFYPNSFGLTKFIENKNIINTVNHNILNKIFEDSIKIFNNLDNLVYCSIDWLYHPETQEYSFCELTPTPYVLSKPIKDNFIKKYINIKN